MFKILLGQLLALTYISISISISVAMLELSWAYIKKLSLKLAEGPMPKCIPLWMISILFIVGFSVFGLAWQ